jgi:hypothetical protein
MTLQHLIWHIIMQVSVIVCAISPMDTREVVLYPSSLPIVVVSYRSAGLIHVPLSLEIQHPGVLSDIDAFGNLYGVTEGYNTNGFGSVYEIQP